MGELEQNKFPALSLTMIFHPNEYFQPEVLKVTLEYETEDTV